MTGKSDTEYLVRVIVMKEGDLFVAQCIDFDIVAQAKTVEALGHEFTRVFIGTIEGYERHGKDMRDHVKPAPDTYLKAFEGNPVPADFPSIPVDHHSVKPQARVLVGTV